MTLRFGGARLNYEGSIEFTSEVVSHIKQIAP